MAPDLRPIARDLPLPNGATPGASPPYRSRRFLPSLCAPGTRWRTLPLLSLLLFLLFLLYHPSPARKLPPGAEIDPVPPLARTRNGGPGRRGEGVVCGVRARMAREGGGWELDRVREMVAETKGYMIRDWSLHLGWNNMRYIIESGINQAFVLNRTLVLPTYVYARNCELSREVCASYGDVIDRTTWGVSSHLPAGETASYRMPLGVMLDLPTLRQHRNVILMSEYLALHGLPASLEPVTGRFSSELVREGMSMYTLSSWDYDGDRVRVDRLPPARASSSTGASRWAFDQEVADRLKVYEHGGMFVQWQNGWRVVSEGKGSRFTEEEAEEVLNAYGYEVLHSYTGDRVEHLKFVGFPVKFIAVRSRMHGWWDEYAHADHDIIWLQGEIHVNRRPSDMWFTTPQARDEYSEFVLYTMHRPANILRVAHRVDMRMRELVGGRMWMAAHMRRGDFTTVDWVSVGSVEAQWKRIQKRLTQGRDVLRQVWDEPRKAYDVPGAMPYRGWEACRPPAPEDPFFLATDERAPENLAFLRNQSAILIDDLLTPEDRQELGWPIVMTDFLGLLEQAILARSAYFVGRMESSVSGGALNMRAAWGMDPRTMSFE